MRLITCPKCKSQFDVATMSPGTSFVCGKCRHVLEVPEAGPVVQPIAPAGGAAPRGAMKPPPTVSMSPDQVRRALRESADVGAARPKAAPPGRQLPKAMQKRAQQAASQSAQRAGATGQVASTPAKAGAGASKRPAQARGRGASKPASKAASRGGGRRPEAQASSAAARGTRRGGSSGSSGGGGGGGGGGKKKSNTGLLAGIGLAVFIIGLVAFLATRGGGDGETGPAGGGQDTASAGADGGADGGGGGAAGANSGASTAGGGAAGNTAGTGSNGGAPASAGGAVAVDPSDEVGVFLALTTQDQRVEFARRIGGAGSDVDALFALFEFFSNERMTSNSVAKGARRTIAETALRADSKLEWANEAFGKKNLRDYLRACRDECPKAFGFAEDDEAKILDRLAELEDGSPWVAAAEFKEFDATVRRIRAREEELEGNPRLVQVEKMKDWVRNNDLFKDFEIIARFEEPYVIFQQYPKFGEGMEHYNAGRIKKARDLAARDAIVFTELNRQFRKLFGERFELPRLEEKGRLLRVLIMWDRKSFDEWHAKQETGMSGLIRAYYSPKERHIVHYVGTEALTEQDYFKCADGRVQKTSDQVTFHEGTHQLMHEYSAIYAGSPLPEDPDVEVPVRMRKSMWFDEGLSEFMGAVEINADDMPDLGGPFLHNRVLLYRVKFARDMRTQKAGKWPLAKMLLPNNNVELLQMGEEISPGRGGLAANEFYAQAWAFVHFSWFYDNGKYRENFLNYMERVLKGDHGPEALAKAYDLPSADDFGDVGKEYDWYWNLLLRRRVGRKKSGVGWYTPETDPPTGKWSPDEDDGGDYDE